MSIVLSQSGYGKFEIRLVKVSRRRHGHDLRDLTVDVGLEGDFDAAYVEGDNTGLIATDTMRNTVYALAKQYPIDPIESFGHRLVEHFLMAGPGVTRARVDIVEHPWARLEIGGRPHGHAFERGSGGDRVATVVGDGGEPQIEAGIDDLLVLKTTDSGWEGFLRDRYTTLPETSDRILATIITARWSYRGRDVDYGAGWREVRRAILEAFCDHYSPSVQFTLHHMGKAVLDARPEVERISFSLPNKHHLLYDLERFGLENQNEIFHATNEPYGLIEGTVERSSG
jgi:urate oxidase